MDCPQRFRITYNEFQVLPQCLDIHIWWPETQGLGAELGSRPRHIQSKFAYPDDGALRALPERVPIGGRACMQHWPAYQPVRLVGAAGGIVKGMAIGTIWICVT